MPTVKLLAYWAWGSIDIGHSTKSLILSTKSGYVRVLFKWCKSGVTYKIPASSKWSESLENAGFFTPIRGVKCISNAFRYTTPPLSSQSFSKCCDATASRFSYFSYLLKSWRNFSPKWYKIGVNRWPFHFTQKTWKPLGQCSIVTRFWMPYWAPSQPQPSYLGMPLRKFPL